MTFKKIYPIYGMYRVTTENDCEGRIMKDLGTYTGYIDDIAFALADKCFYSLHFELVEPQSVNTTPKSNTVKISLDVNSTVWNMPVDESKEYFKQFFASRNIEVLEAHGCGSCTITNHVETLEEKRNKILSKLTKEEQHILGLDVH